jgi:hypothetical protein
MSDEQRMTTLSPLFQPPNFQAANQGPLRANKAKEILWHAHARYIQAGVPKDILAAMEPHVKEAARGYYDRHVKGSQDATPEVSLGHIATLGAFGGAPEAIGENLQRLLAKHGL